MDFILTEEGRRGNRQVTPRRHDFYPKWGMEEPRYASNAHELYRYDEKGILTRYIVPPADVIDQRRRAKGKRLLGNTAYELLRMGVAVEDVLIGLTVGALMALLVLLWIDVIGIGFDGYLDAVGY